MIIAFLFFDNENDEKEIIWIDQHIFIIVVKFQLKAKTMRFFVFIVLVLVAFSGAQALKKRQLQQVHQGYCPVNMFVCAIYCPPNLPFPTTVDGACRLDNECAQDEKCCQPACGCFKRCTKSQEKPGLIGLS